MPRFEHRSILEIAREVRAYVNVEAGLTRGPVPGPGAEGRPEGRLDPSNVVWIFGFGRSGTTWLTQMLQEPENHLAWIEPTVGALFGNLYYRDARRSQLESRTFVLGSQREVWTALIRSFFLGLAGATFPKADRNTILVVKETDGTLGAPLLSEALPESRMVVIVRDPRDAIASRIDAFGGDGWGAEKLGEDAPEFSAERWASFYMRQVGNARAAYESHAGPKALVRYEDLLADTLGTMRRVYDALGIEVGELLEAVVERHLWRNIPEDQKGEGRFYRKATPGSWREDLTPEQARQIERVAAPIIEEFYSG